MCVEKSSRTVETGNLKPTTLASGTCGPNGLPTDGQPFCMIDFASTPNWWTSTSAINRPFHAEAADSNNKRKYYCWQDVKDPDFVVWMRTAGLPTFKKLHRIIPDGQMGEGKTLKKGTYFLKVNSRYNVAAFKGKKSIVLSTVSWVGGKNVFLGGAYVTVGALCVLLGTIFLARHLVSPRELGDQRYLVWKQ